MNLFSISLTASNYLLHERIDYPDKKSVFITFLIMVPYLVITLSKALLFSVISFWLKMYTVNDTLIQVYGILGFVLVHVLLVAILMKNENSSMVTYTLDERESNLGAEEKKEYQRKINHDFDQYTKELKIKAVMFSIFAPCINLFEESDVLRITSLVSVSWSILTIAGCTIFTGLQTYYFEIIHTPIQNLTSDMTLSIM